MTDWERVARLRTKGRAWAEIAEDEKVGFHPPEGIDAGRALKGAWLARRSRQRPAASSNEGSSPLSRPPSRRISSALRRHPYRVLGLALLAVLVASLLYLLVLPPSHNDPFPAYCSAEATDVHYHVLLLIYDGGTQQALPYQPGAGGDIGVLDQSGYTNPSLYCPSGELHLLHTHDGSGIIHVEMPGGLSGTPTLGDFFQIWGEPLSSGGVWTFSGTVSAQMHDMDMGSTTSYSGDPGAMPFYQPPGGPTSNPYSIPPSLIWNGQYGNGQSGTTFDGEIIWLNVTA
ncbi:MAG: hypothetical protein KGJ23_03905 [Euryarchaeota archaeon]|nr:hypothetical protein [Euryarchaeota archaeon]MDE1835744.1 hypothetical protein [Euryarchaeota archaeon]MDE1880831.1 hypothetical protein [Euryarchaeota archaeon]MDE2043935.1 hypothetical protein [Thermoplasmata archaeon]